MEDTKLRFSNSLPEPQIILEGIKTKFPAAKAKQSFNGFIDIKMGDVAASLDLTATEIIVSTKANTMRPKFILVLFATFIPYMYLLFEYTDLHAGGWHFGLAIAVFLAIWRGFIYLKTKQEIKMVHHYFVSFLEENYEGVPIQ